MEFVHWLHANLLVLAADGVTPIRLGFSSKTAHSTSQAVSQPSPVLLLGDGTDAHAVFLAPAPTRGVGAAAALKANAAHDRVALVGPSSICVCDLTPGIAVLRRDGYVRHIVVLLQAARGGALSIVVFDVSAASSAAPDVDILLPPHAFTTHRPIALCCGEARGWELLTLFILCEDATVFSLCPLLPPQVLLPAADWSELLQSADAVTAAWLQSCFEAVEGDSWRRYTSASTHAYFATGSRSRLAPCLNGPLVTQPSIASITHSESDTGREPACAIAALSAAATEFTTLAILTTHGRLVFLGSMDPMMPAWGRPTLRDGVEELPMVAVTAGASPDRPVRGRVFATPGRARATGVDTASPSSTAAEAATVPWVVLDAIDLDLDGAVSLARESIASGGAAYAGGMEGDGLAEESGVEPDSEGDHATSDIIAVPLLLCDPARSDTLYVASRRTLHAVRCDWLPRSRALLADGDITDAVPPTLVKSLHDAQDEDVAGTATCSQDGGDALRSWILPAHASVLVTLPQGAGPSTTGTPHRPSLLRPPPSSRGSTAPASAAARAPVTAGRLHSFSAAAAAPPAAADATSSAGTSGGGPAPASTLLELEPFEQIMSDARADLATIAASALASDMSSSVAPIDNLARGVEALTQRAAMLGDLRARMHARARVLVDAAASARSRAEAVGKDVARVHAAHAKAQDRMTVCDARAADLRARAQAILLALSLRQRVWSAAEAQYSAEVHDVADDLRTRIPSQLQKLSDLMAAITGPASSAATATPADVRNLPGFDALLAELDELRSTVHDNEVALADVTTTLTTAATPV